MGGDEMGFFDSDELELNLGNDHIEQDDDENENDDQQNGVDPNINNNPSEDDSEKDDSENVAKEDDPQEGDEGDDSPNLFSSVASVLHGEGVLPSLDIETLNIESAEDLATAVKSEVENLYKSKLVERFGEEGYEFVNNGVPIKEYQEYQDNNTALDNITEETLYDDIELSKRIVYQDYINKGLSNDKALKFVERAFEIGEDALIEDAKESLLNIKGFNKQRILDIQQSNIQAEKEAEIQRVENERKVKDSVYGVTELFKGQSITKSMQDKVYKSITNIVSNDPQGNPENALMKARREDTINFDTKLYYLFELTKGFTDFTKVNKTGKNNAISEMQRAIKSNQHLNNDLPGYVNDKNSYDGSLGDELNI